MGERLPEALRVSAFELLRQQNVLGDTGAARLAAISRAGVGVPAPPVDPIGASAAENLLATQTATSPNFRAAAASVYVASAFGATAGSTQRAGAMDDPLRRPGARRDIPMPVEHVMELRGEQLELETSRREIESRQSRIPEEVVEDQLERLEAIQRRLREIDEQLSAYGASSVSTRPRQFPQEAEPIGSGRLFRALI
jgi:hypothetical protein